MTALAVRVFWLSVTTAPVLLPLLLLRRRLLDKHRVKHCYLLWLILCLRLILPLDLSVSHPPVTVILPDSVSVLSVPISGQLSPGHTQLHNVPETKASAFTPLDCFSLLWLAGVLFSLCLHTGGYCLARRRLLSGTQPDPHGQALAEQLSGAAPVLRTNIDTPITLGLLHPVILLSYNTHEDDLEMILRHELCHIRRRDLWYKGLFLLCACIYWFNPLVWLLAKAAGETVELCCDEDVAAGQDTQFKLRYGQSLLRAAADSDKVVLSTSFGNGQMKERLINLFAEKKKSGLLLCALCGAALCIGCLVGCQVSAADHDLPAPSASASEVPAQNVPTPEPAAPSASPSEVPAQEGPAPKTVWPVEEHYTLSAVYGDRLHPITGEQHSHSGVDIPAEQGTLVLAALDGTVTDCRFDEVLGNCVELTHEDGCTSLYGCLQEICVEAGNSVLAGQVIGKVGATGQATGHHLHYEVRNQQGHHTDPLCGYPTKEFFHHAH